MKRSYIWVTVILAVLSALAALCGSAAALETDLSPDLKCPVQPMIYCNPRYLNEQTGRGYDLKNGLSANQINNNTSGREYGLYFKFTPRGANGYMIKRFDFVIQNEDGDNLYIDGIDTNMECKNGYYWSWEFFPLQGLFTNMELLYGEVVPGQYTMDIYFNSLWAGQAKFRIQK